MLLLASLTFFGGKKQPSIGSIEGIVLDNGVPIKATIRILRDGYPGIPNYETVVLVLVTRHFAGSGAMTFPVDAPGMYHLTTDKKGHFADFGLPVGGYSVGH